MILYSQKRFGNPSTKIAGDDPLGLLSQDEDTLAGKLSRVKLFFKDEFESLGFVYTGWIHEQLKRLARAKKLSGLTTESFRELRMSDPVANLCAGCMKEQEIRFYFEDGQRLCYECVSPEVQSMILQGLYKSKK